MDNHEEEKEPLIAQSRAGEAGTNLTDVLAAIRSQLNVQGQNGNWNYDPYMHGMYNGLECALATMEGRDPEYRKAPDEWIYDGITQPKSPQIEATSRGG